MITLVMLNMHRTDQAARIVAAERSYPLIDRCIVWNNNPAVFCQFPGVDCINSSRDQTLFTRFAGAALAKTDAVLLQDDDLLIPRDTLGQLYEAWRREPGVAHGTQGRTVEGGRYVAADRFGAVDIVLTRCVLVHREICLDALRYRPFFEDLDGDGEDIVLSAAAYAKTRRKNRAYQLPFENLAEPRPISGRPGHIENRTEFVRRCTEIFSK